MRPHRLFAADVTSSVASAAAAAATTIVWPS
jgi:hypothetical protein